NVGVISYLVLRCAGAGCNPSAPVSSPTTTSFNNTGLTPSTSYSYKVVATDAAGNNSSSSAAASATTPAGPDTIPPTNPSNLTANAPSSSRIDLPWTASTDNVGVTGYQLQRCSGLNCRNFANTGSLIAATNFSDTGLTSSTIFNYRLSARDAAGNFS